MKRETVHELSALCRIKTKEEEEASFEKEFAAILGYFKKLDELDTEGVEPLDHVMKEIHNVFREDKVQAGLDRKTFLDNAPSQIGGLIKVPRVIKEM